MSVLMFKVPYYKSQIYFLDGKIWSFRDLSVVIVELNDYLKKYQKEILKCTGGIPLGNLRSENGDILPVMWIRKVIMQSRV